MDDLYEACERGEEIFISTLDPSSSEKIANINVNEALDMVKYLYSENPLENKGRFVTDFKFKVTDIPSKGDSTDSYESAPLGYDYLVALGCRNCGALVDFKNNHMFFDFNNVVNNKVEPNKLLRCETCDSVISPIFKKNESDSFFDNMNKVSKKEEDDSYVYLYGTRSGYVFDESEKQWWKDAAHGTYSSNQLLQAKTANKSGKQTVKFNCEKCGHDVHLYSTFQARSADEGMSIMYECVKCKNRVVMAT